MGILFVLAASMIYGIEPSVRTLALNEGVTPEITMVFSSAPFFLLSVFHCAVERKSVRIGCGQIMVLFAAGSVGMGLTSFLLTMAYQYIPVGCATVIHFMYPSLVCLAMCLLFGERMTWNKGLAMVLSVVGVLLISGGGFSGSVSGILLALCSSFTYTFYIVTIDKKDAGELPQCVRMFYMALGCLALSIAGGLLSKNSAVLNPYSIVVIVICGALSYAAAFFYSSGVRRVGGVKAAFFSLVEPITSMIFSTAVYHYSFSAVTILGCLLAILAILVVNLHMTQAGYRHG